MPALKGYSLWFMPEDKVYERLKSIIVQLNKKCNIPSFEPHVTLIGELDNQEKTAISKSAQLANVIEPFRID